MSTELTLFFIVETILILLIIGVRSLLLQPIDMTEHELKRRVKSKDEKAKHQLRKHVALSDLTTLRQIVETILIVTLVIYTVDRLAWLVGALLSVVILILINTLSRLKVVTSIVQKIQSKYEVQLLQFVEKIQPALKFVRLPNSQPAGEFVLHSKEELLHIIEGSKGTLSQDERDLLTSAMSLQTKPVKEVMTPRSAISSVKSKELLGPLVLDDLHKTGHTRFPVIQNDIDHVVGMLYVQDLLTLDTKRSVTAQKAMDAHVYYIHEDQTLEHALAGFLRTHHHLFIVVNEFRETVGVLSLEDVIEALIGRKINDEFDTHEDLREVAQRNIQKNNDPESRVDV